MCPAITASVSAMEGVKAGNLAVCQDWKVGINWDRRRAVLEFRLEIPSLREEAVSH